MLFVLLRIHLTLGYVNVRNLNNYDVLMFKALYAEQLTVTEQQISIC